PRGKEGEWDNVALLQGHAFVNVGDQTYIWYSHWDTGASLTNMHIGLATLRRDGFGYVATKHKNGEGGFVTDTVELTAPEAFKVKVNVEGATAQAPLKLELLNDRDQPLGDATSVTTSGTQVEVKWSKAPVLKKGDRLALRAHFPKAADVRVYSLYIDQP
ncbi:MAG TPA: hypothetical protein VD994_06575, partial [Prosthecobacter sp.]|nr:hypothetical protein [Prosthecobacter sp.]